MPTLISLLCITPFLGPVVGEEQPTENVLPEPKALTTEPIPEETPPEIDAVELVTSVGKVVNDWKNVGWLAGVIAMINFLLSLLRFKPINMAMDRLDIKWLKPLIATLLGAALGGFSTFSTGAGVLNSIVAGMLAGLGSVGFHELVDNLRKQSRKPSSSPGQA